MTNGSREQKQSFKTDDQSLNRSGWERTLTQKWCVTDYSGILTHQCWHNSVLVLLHDHRSPISRCFIYIWCTEVFCIDLWETCVNVLQLVSGVRLCCLVPSLMLPTRSWLLRCPTCLLLRVSVSSLFPYISFFVCIKVGPPLIVFLYIRNGTQRCWIQEVFGSRPVEHDPADNWAGISLCHTNTTRTWHSESADLCEAA